MKKNICVYVFLINIFTLQAQNNRANDCSNSDETFSCEPGYICQLGECVPDVEEDRDYDGVPNAVDNCIDVPNAPQLDLDQDGIGDACDDDVRPGAIYGYISYYVNDERLDLALINATIRLKRRSDPAIIAETQTDDTGQYGLINLPLTLNDMDDLVLEVISNDYLPSTINNLSMRKFYELSLGGVNFYPANLSSRKEFIIYPPGNIMGRAMLSGRPRSEAVHQGTKITVRSYNLDGSLDEKSSISLISGAYEIRGVRQIIEDVSAICCVSISENNWIISPRYIGRIDSELNVGGHATTTYDITMEEFIPNYVELMRLSAKELSRERFKSSLNYGQEALNELKNAKQSSIVDEALINTNLGSVSLINGQFQDALSYFDTALEILDKNAASSNALSLAVNNHKMLIYEKMGNFKLMKEAQGETEEILNDLSQKSPDHSFNIIDDLLLKVHPSMNEFFMQKLSENDFVERLKMCSENEFYVGGNCIPINFEKKSKKK
ncbi:MAG: tetratricopeptide repeat protein [Candidatus Neomarinimicrobiota bacterium]|nr:tetratricopeptide repeat protein [Candidatus Neomarinimicrobiota bacterium]